METILELLGLLGHALDTPGAYTRGLFAGRPGERVGGRDMLESWGLLGENQPGFDGGDALGFGAEMLFDPLNLLGGAGLAKLMGRAGQVKRANQAAQSHNLMVDTAKAKASEITSREAQDVLGREIARRVSASDPAKTINVRKVPREISEGWDREASGWGREITEQDKLDMLYGTQEQVAQAAGRMIGFDPTSPHPAIEKMVSQIPVRAFGMSPVLSPDQTKSLGGFVLRERPDVMFTPTGTPLPTTLGMGGHELVHVMARSHPESYGMLRDSLGSNVTQAAADRYFGDDLSRMLHELTYGQSATIEEGVAAAVEQALKRGASRQTYPLVDAAFNTDPAGAVYDLSQSLRQAYPGVTNPAQSASPLVQMVTGELDRARSLVPTGQVSPAESAFKSFAPPPVLTEAERLALGSGYMDPFASRPPSANPLIGAILGHNVGARGLSPLAGGQHR